MIHDISIYLQHTHYIEQSFLSHLESHFGIETIISMCPFVAYMCQNHPGLYMGMGKNLGMGTDTNLQDGVV